MVERKLEASSPPARRPAPNVATHLGIPALGPSSIREHCPVEPALVAWLDQIGSLAFTWSVGLFVALNGVAAFLFFTRRDRTLVNKWTSRLLAVDLLLLGTGAGIPLVASLTKMTVSAVAGAVTTTGIATVELKTGR